MDPKRLREIALHDGAPDEDNPELDATFWQNRRGDRQKQRLTVYLPIGLYRRLLKHLTPYGEQEPAHGALSHYVTRLIQQNLKDPK